MEGIKGTAEDELFEFVAAGADAGDEIEEGGEGSGGFDDTVEGLAGEAMDEAKVETDSAPRDDEGGVIGTNVFDQNMVVAEIDINGEDLEAADAGFVDKGGRAVISGGLGIEEGGEVFSGEVLLTIDGSSRDFGEGKSVALSESVALESDDELEDFFGDFRGVSSLDDSSAEGIGDCFAVVVVAFFVDFFAGFFGFAAGVADKMFEELVDLFLEDDDAVGVANDFFESGIREGVFFSVASGDEGVEFDGSSDSGADSGLDEAGIFEVLGADSGMSLGHGGGSGLRDADGLVGAHCGIDGRVIGFEFADTKGWVGLAEAGLGAREDILTA